MICIVFASQSKNQVDLLQCSNTWFADSIDLIQADIFRYSTTNFIKYRKLKQTAIQVNSNCVPFPCHVHYMGKIYSAIIQPGSLAFTI